MCFLKIKILTFVLSLFEIFFYFSETPCTFMCAVSMDVHIKTDPYNKLKSLSKEIKVFELHINNVF